MNTSIIRKNNESGMTRNWDPMWELHHKFNQLFEDSGVQAWRPLVDLEEDDQRFMLTAEMPGVPKDHIRIEVKGNELFLSGERSGATEKKEKGKYYSERSFGRFERRFTLPNGVEVDKIEAQYQDGVLKLAIPKAENSKPRQIPIRHFISSGSQSGLTTTAQSKNMSTPNQH